MRSKKLILFGMIFLFGILLIGFISGYVSSNPKYTQSGFGYSQGFGFGFTTGDFFFDKKMCEAGKDFILQIDPLGCEPAVVRSDLLEDQNVHVFCPIRATQINPLAKVEAIDYLTFRGAHAPGIADIGFHPARSALGIRGDLNSPVLENIGYAVIELKRIPNEADMPDFIEGNITARIRYDIENAFGVGKANFYLEPMTDDEWEKEFVISSFWKGRGFVRAEDVGTDRATISVYSGNTITAGRSSFQQKLATFDLKEGEKSRQIYLPTFDYCAGGLEVSLNDVENPDTTARLSINAEEVEIAEGEKFLDGRCRVRDLEKLGLNQEVVITCSEDIDGGFFGKSTDLSLKITPQIKLDIQGKEEEYEIGDRLFDVGVGDDAKTVFLSYAYTQDDTTNNEDLRAVLIAIPEQPDYKDKLTEEEISSFKEFVERYRFDKSATGASFWDQSLNVFKGVGYAGELFTRWAVSGESFYVLNYQGSEKIDGTDVKVLGFGGPVDLEFIQGDENYKNANKDFDTLISDFSELKEIEGVSDSYGERALTEKIKLARATGQRLTMINLCEEFKKSYLQGNLPEECFNDLEISNSEISTGSVLINGEIKEISFKGIFEPSLKEYSAEILVEFPDGSFKNVQLGKNNIFYLGKSTTGSSEIVSVAEQEFSKWSKVKECTPKGEEYLEDYFDSAKFDDWSCSDTPWSGAFISYIMDEAGVDFPYNAGHASYFSEIRNNPQNYECEAFTMNSFDNAHPGDVVCKCRGSSCLGSYSYDNPPPEGHCDIVANVKGEIVETIGGNIDDSVKKESIRISEIKSDDDYYGFISCKESGVALSRDFIQLTSLDDASAEIDARIGSRAGYEKAFQTNSFTLEKDAPKGIGDYRFTLKKSNLEKVAKVSVLPRINYAETEADVKFRIEIDKRDFKLSPEKASEKITKLNKSIEQFNKISDGLDKTVKTLKTACLATGAGLTIKNLAENAGGKGIARQKVMRSDGGWYERCADFINSGKYSTQDECLIKESDNIDQEVRAMEQVLNNQNSEIKLIQSKHTKGDKKFLGEQLIDSAGFAGDYSAVVLSSISKANLGTELSDPEGKGDPISLDALKNSLTIEGYENGNYDIEDLKNIDLYSRLANSEDAEVRNLARKRLYKVLVDIDKNSEQYLLLKQAESSAEERGFSGMVFRPYTDEKRKQEIYDGKIAEKDLRNIQKGDLIQGIWYNNKEYIVALENIGEKKYGIKEVYTIDGVKADNADLIKNAYSHFQEFDKSSYKNKFKYSFLSESAKPELRYFETEPYSGLPAVVPFDLDDGWYAGSKGTLPIGGHIRSFDASGRVNSFYLCNVGENGIEEFNFQGDDICQLINLEVQGTYTQFPGLEENEARQKVACAVDAIEDASRAYKSGVKAVRISTRCGSVNANVGSPSVSVPDIQCQDFMSPKECNLLFNVCDPVICPSSRCDFGGAYPVRDVIQSGIVGSLALCAPNVKENIAVPVCLTGVKASVDGFNSVQKSYSDCLKESLETGQQIGICDEIHSIYLCEFAWREAIPLAKVAIPKILSNVLNQNTRGGGEYLGFQNAWETAGKSVDFFTQSYAINSYNAFKVRSAEQIGTPICKNFVSIVAPNIDAKLDALTEPDSPPQFHGRFDEIPFTTATVPPVSQYKVFFHIYAGNDRGAHYRVYLRQGPESSFYQDTAFLRMVDSGYIAVGETITKTPDFTAPSGYKELCINVNGQEVCDFKEVSTSFAVDYIQDKYIEEQGGKRDIKSESECISGSASLYNLLTPNVQSSAEGAINPEIYGRGLIRICATGNPGLGTDSNIGAEGQRWIDVGYCGNENNRCWLDKTSLKDSIEFSNIEKKALDEAEKYYNEKAFSEGNFTALTEELRKKIEDEKDPQKKISLINEIMGKVFFNRERAKLFFERGKAYAQLAVGVYDNWKEEQIKKEFEESTIPEGIDEEGLPAEGEFNYFDETPIVISDPENDLHLSFSYRDGEWYVWNGGDVFFDLERAKSDPEYEFTFGEWVSVGETAKLESLDLNEAGKKFVSGFDGETYDEGLQRLIIAVLKSEGSVLSANNIEMSDVKIFKVETGKIEIGNIYFYFKDRKWHWNFYEEDVIDGKNWVEVPMIGNKAAGKPTGKVEVQTLIGPSIPEETQELIKSLEGKEFYNGAGILFGIKKARVVEKKEKETLLTIPKKYDKIIKKYSELYGVDPNLVKAVIKVESNFNPTAVSPTGCKGLMQFCESTAIEYGLCDSKGCNVRDDRFDAEKNIEAGVKYLKGLLNKYQQYGDPEKIALAAYNDGGGVIGTAIFRTEKRDDLIKWEDVKIQITVDVLNQFQVYKSFSQSAKEAKIIEIQQYPDKVFSALEELEEASSFSDKEVEIIQTADSCEESCGDSFWNICDKDECEAIGKALGKECVFKPSVGWFGGSCVEKK